MSLLAGTLWQFAVCVLLPLTAFFGLSGERGAILVCATTWLLLLGAWMLMPVTPGRRPERGEEDGPQTAFREFWSWRSPAGVLLLAALIMAGLLGLTPLSGMDGSTLLAIQFLGLLLAITLLLHFVLCVPLGWVMAIADRTGRRMSRSTGRDWLQPAIRVVARAVLLAGTLWVLLAI